MPKLLTLAVDDIAAAHARLAEYCLTADEAAAALVAQPGILLTSRSELRDAAEVLQVGYRLSPLQLHDAIVEMPECLLLDCDKGVSDQTRNSLCSQVARAYAASDVKKLEHVIDNIR